MDGLDKLKFFHLARWAARVAGHPIVFILALGTVFVWIITGPIFEFSDTWQLVINTGTTIVTFLMVFLIQNSQNRDSMAIHLKLDELVRAIRAAQNTVLNLDELDEEELYVLLEKYQKLGKDAREKLEAVGKKAPASKREVRDSPVEPHGVH